MPTATQAAADLPGGDLTPPPELRQRWKAPFKEQLDFFSQKVNVPTQHWDDVRGPQNDRAFVVAGAMKAELLTDLRTAMQRVQTEGKSFDWWQKQFDATVEKHGWQHTGSRRWRAKVIYETNMQASYAAGREKKMADPELRALKPYDTWRHSELSQLARALHKAWNGVTVEPDSEWRKTHSAPCGFGCKCRWVMSGRAQYRTAKANGLATPPDDGTYEHVDRWGEVHVLPRGVDYGWGHRQGATWQPDMRRYPKPIADDFEAELAKKKAADEARKAAEEAARKAAEELAKKKAAEEAARKAAEAEAARKAAEELAKKKAADEVARKAIEDMAKRKAAEEAARKAAEEAARKAAEELAKKKAAQEAANPEQWHKRIEDEVQKARQRPEIARTSTDHDKLVKAVQDAVAKGETRPVGTLNASVQKALGATSAEIKLADADVVRCALHGHKIADAPERLKQIFSTAKLAVQDGKTLHICGQNAAGKWQMATLETTENGEVLLKMLAGTTQREALELAKLGKPLMNKVPDLPPLADTDFVKAGAEITQSMPELDANNPQDWHAELYRRVRLLGRLGGGSKNLATPTGEAVAATRMYPQAWVDVSDGLGVVHSSVSATGRGYAWTANVDRAIPGTLTEFLDLKQVKKGEGVITHSAGDVGTAIHEYAHRLQTAIPRLDRLFQRLHLGRVSKDPLEQLKTVTGNTGYKDDEVTRKDHYVNSYQGKEYAVKDGKALAGGALEVITMAMEAVVGGNALKPKKLPTGQTVLTLRQSHESLNEIYRGDREVLDLVVGTLLHFKP